MAKKRKGGVRSTVLLDPETIEAVCLAELGKNNDYIRDKQGIALSNGQLQYRLTRAKKVAGYAAGDGFRKAWREGRSHFEREIISTLMPHMREHYNAEILPQVERPTPKVSPKADPANAA